MCQTLVNACSIPVLCQFFEFTRKAHENGAVVFDDRVRPALSSHETGDRHQVGISIQTFNHLDMVGLCS